MREDWIECNLLDIVKIEYGKGLPTSKLIPDGYNVFGANGVIGKHSVYNTEYSEVLISCRGAASGKINLSPPKCFITNNSLILKRKSETLIDKLYLYYNLISVDKSNIITGSAQPQVTIDKAQYLKIYLSPLPEQRAIVKKLESLLSSLDAGVADLKKAQQQLKMYRQAVLKKAFEGEWDKKKIIETCSNIKVGIVIKPTQFYSSDNTGVKVFRSANVKEFRIQDSNWVYFSLQGNEINKRTQVKEDDILIVRTGYPGTSCIVTKEYVNTNAIDILIATPDKNIILPKYLCAFNNSPYGKGLFSEGSRGVAQKHLNVGVYSNLIIPVPPIKNQLKIIKQLESGLSVCDSIEQNIKESLEKAEALRQSILKRAFEGNLLTAQELAECKLADDYEPASVLLERIKAEQTEIKAKPSKKKPRHSVAKSQ